MLVLCEEPDVRSARGHPFLAGQPPVRPRQRPGAEQPFMDMRAVLRIVALEPQDARPRGNATSPTGFDARLLNVLEACYVLNTARLQMLNVLDIQTALDRLVHIQRAREGLEPTRELRKLEKSMAEMRRTVLLAGDAWHRSGRVFTRMTRLLPVQLEEAAPCFEPLDTAEMARLAYISERLHMGSDAALKRLAHERAQHRDRCAPWVAPTPDQRHAWASRMQEACNKAASPFAEARECYEKAVVDHADARERTLQADHARHAAENGFRLGEREAHEFAVALIEHSQLRRETLQKAARACVARYTLYAVAGLLLEQCDLASIG